MTFHSTICSTKILNTSVKEILHEAGLSVHEAEQLEIRYRHDHETLWKIENQRGAVVVTSRHGIEGALSNINGRKLNATGLFCLSGESLLAARQLGIPILATAENGRNLAGKIIDSGVSSITYFCGEIHRPELTHLLLEGGIQVSEVVVYSAIAKGERVTRPFDHVLFFSPRSAEIFLHHNHLPEEAVCFCIGETTAAYLRESTRNRVVASPLPTQADLARVTVEFLERHQSPEAAPHQ